MLKKTRLIGAAVLAAGTLTVPMTAFAAANPAAAATTTPAANLRVELSQLLGAHAILAQLAMQAGYSGAKDYPDLASALSQNTAELSQAIASVYGPAAGQAFKKLWAAHIQDFVNYVVATKEGSRAGQQKALAALTQYRVQFSQFMHKADPFINTGALSQSLQIHVNQLIATFKAYVAKDYGISSQDFVKAYQHMFMSGDYLAGAIVEQFPSKFANSNPNTPAVNLRIALDELLGGHAAIAQLAMETGFTGPSAQFTGWANVLTQNTAQLSAAVGSVYGPAAGAAFKTLWTSHINDFVHYVAATKSHSATGQQAALSALANYQVQAADFFNGANPKNFSKSVLEATLKVHVTQLITSFKSYVAGNYTAFAPQYVMAYNHMFMDGGYLSAGIVDQFPSKFGVSMVANATSPVTGIPFLPVVAAGAGLAMAGAAALLKRSGERA